MTLKLRAKVNFPATVTATGGLQVVKANGAWTVSPDWSYLTLETTIPDASARQLWTLDPVSGSYYRLSVQALIDNLPEGPPGTAATIAAGTATAVAAGSSPSVSNSGTSDAAVFNFTIPRGADAGLRYAFESSTSMAAPASGGLRLNNAALASVTAIAINATNSDAVDASDWIATWDDSTNTVKGYVEIRKEGSGAVLGLYQLISVTDNTTWLQFSVAYVSGSGSFTAADSLYLTPYRTGNKGADGVGTGDVVGPSSSVDGEIALFNSTTGKLIKRASMTGLVKATSGVASAATAGTDYYNPGGTDVALADGGTGASNAAGALANLTARGQGTETISVPGLAIWARTTAGPGAASRELTTGDDIMIKGLAFDATTEEAAQFYLRMPKSWNLGTVTAQVYWTNASGLTTETVTWGISAVALHDSDPMDSTSLGTEVTVTDTWLAQNDLHISSVTGAITFANTPAVGDLCIVQIARKTGTDNMTGDAELLDLVLFFTTNAATDA